MNETQNYSIAKIYLSDYHKYTILNETETAKQLLKIYEQKKTTIKDPALITDLETTLYNIENRKRKSGIKNIKTNVSKKTNY